MNIGNAQPGFINQLTNSSLSPTDPLSKPGRSETTVPIIHGTFSTVSSPKKWHEHKIDYLNKLDEIIDEKIPNFKFQNKLDQIGRTIEKKFEPLTQFNEWLNQNGKGGWYKQLAIFLYKLPMRAVRNVIQLIYNIVKGACYAAVHPLKAANQLAKMIITLIHELTKPETWSKIGAGVIGASLGNSLATGNPFSIIGIGIGGAMLIGGLTFGAVKAAIEAKEGKKLEAMTDNTWNQMKQLPESLLTGFCMGLLLGGIQKAFRLHEAKTYHASSQEAQDFATKFIKEHFHTSPESVTVDPSGDIHVIFKFGNQSRELVFQSGGTGYVPDPTYPVYHIPFTETTWKNLYTYPEPPLILSQGQATVVGSVANIFQSTIVTENKSMIKE